MSRVKFAKFQEYLTSKSEAEILKRICVLKNCNNYYFLCNNQSKTRALIGQSATVYCVGNLMEKKKHATCDNGRTREEFGNRNLWSIA